MFKKGQVVALKHPWSEEQEPEFFKIAAVVGKKIIPENGDNDPRIFYTEDQLRPLTKEEVGDV
jgi:hypothetical protein